MRHFLQEACGIFVHLLYWEIQRNQINNNTSPHIYSKSMLMVHFSLKQFGFSSNHTCPLCILNISLLVNMSLSIDKIVFRKILFSTLLNEPFGEVQSRLKSPYNAWIGGKWSGRNCCSCYIRKTNWHESWLRVALNRVELILGLFPILNKIDVLKRYFKKVSYFNKNEGDTFHWPTLCLVVRFCVLCIFLVIRCLS